MKGRRVFGNMKLDEASTMAFSETRQHAHELIDRMAPGQVSAVVGLLEIMLDPLSRTLANAPYDDEPVTEDEAREMSLSREWFKRNQAIPHEEVLAEFGLSSDDFERMSKTPLDQEVHNPGR